MQRDANNIVSVWNEMLTAYQNWLFLGVFVKGIN